MRPVDVEDFVTEQNEYVWNEGDVDGMRRYYAPWYVHHDFARPDVRSLRDHQGWTRQLLSSLQGLHVRVDALVAEEDRSVKRWTLTGIHAGTLGGVAPTGSLVVLRGVSTYFLSGERIVEGWHVYDLYGVLRRLRETGVARGPLVPHFHGASLVDGSTLAGRAPVPRAS